MITLLEFFHDQDPQLAEVLGGLFSRAKRRNPLFDHEQFGSGFATLVKKHGGDEKAAEEELRQLVQTPAGRHQVMRMGSNVQMPNTSRHVSLDQDGPQRVGPMAATGQDMYKPTYQ